MDGSLVGTTPQDAFFVPCDHSATTPLDINPGRVIWQVGVAPVQPAEFVVLRIGRMFLSRGPAWRWALRTDLGETLT